MGSLLPTTRIPPRSTPLASIVLLAALLAGCGPRPAGDAQLVALAEDQIDADGLLDTVRVLADPDLDGRLAGADGYRRAADAMAARFAELGLEPGTAGGYLQPVALEANRLGAVSFAIEDGVDRELQPGRDFAARGFSGAGRVTAPVVFAGYGLSLPERGWDDYAGLDATGKIVLAIKDAPPWSIGDEGWGEAPKPRPKAHAAMDHGAVGLLLVSTPDAWLDAVIGSVAHGPGEPTPSFPAMQISTELADVLLAGAGTTLAGARARLDEDRAPHPLPLGIEASIAVEAHHDPAAEAANVVAVLPGRDRRHAAEHVILGAHLDHVGSQGGAVYPGANDNASGVAAVIATAEALVRGGFTPRRSVVFALFAGEEQGLLGSEAYVAAPPLPLHDAVAMINVDCIGLGEAIKLGGGEAHPALWELARALDAAAAGRTVAETWYGGGADAQPFFDAGVPTLYVHTTESYAHLHQPTDTVETLEPALFTDTARLVATTTAAVADGRYDPDERRPPPQ